MIRYMILTLTALMLVSAMSGCSQSASTVPGLADAAGISADNHELWGYYHLYIDPAGPSIEIVPAREVMMHFNVKPYLNPPQCNDCIKLQPTGPYKNHILPVNVILKNPKGFAGYDVRGILLSDDPDAKLNNPDNYTDLFDNGGAVTINPFKAFAKAVGNRKFGSGESYTEGYDLYLSKFNKVSVIDYAVDASFPSRAKEPYEISDVNVDGEIDNFGENIVDITIDVFAAGDDVDEVLFDLSSLGVSGEQPLEYVSGNTWKLVFQNTSQPVAGKYICMCRASTSSSTKYLYRYFTLTVVLGTFSLSGDVQPILDEYCILCHQSISPPLGLDLTEGHTYSNTVNVDSDQSPLKRILPGDDMGSYLYGKIIGAFELPPFSGSGDWMPKNGPPYIPQPEMLIIRDWIKDGALDN